MATIYSIIQISQLLNDVLAVPPLTNVYVKGEVSSSSIKAGHRYFSLIQVDDESSLNPIKYSLSVSIFRGNAHNIEEGIKDGDEVIVKGSFNYYGPFGRLSLIGTHMAHYGEGQGATRLRELKEKLIKEGLVSPDRKKRIPPYPTSIAVITSEVGAAFHDISETIHSRFPVPVTLYPSLVQGKEAPKSIMKALKEAFAAKPSIIIIGRGGGSKLDLDAYNDEALAYLVASSKIPIISAVGHQIDETIIDFVSDVKAITPTDAGIKATPLLSDVRKKLDSSLLKMKEIIDDEYHLSSLRFLNLSSRPALKSPAYLFTQMGNRVEKLEDLAKASIKEQLNKAVQLLALLKGTLKLRGQGVKFTLENNQGRLKEIEKDLQNTVNLTYKNSFQRYQRAANLVASFDPFKTLKRGYSLTYDLKGNPLSSISSIKVGDELKELLTDGELVVKVLERTEK